jgi:hypothetical protein
MDMKNQIWINAVWEKNFIFLQFNNLSIAKRNRELFLQFSMKQKQNIFSLMNISFSLPNSLCLSQKVALLIISANIFILSSVQLKNDSFLFDYSNLSSEDIRLSHKYHQFQFSAFLIPQIISFIWHFNVLHQLPDL